MVMLDTNIILRYLLNDNKDMASVAKQIIQGKDVWVSIEIMAEVVYVLAGVYGVGRQKIGERLLLGGMNHARNDRICKGCYSFTEGQLEKYEPRYDTVIAEGREQNKKTKGRIAKKEEKALLNRLEKYKENHLLFLHDFAVPFSNNMKMTQIVHFWMTCFHGLRTCQNVVGKPINMK